MSFLLRIFGSIWPQLLIAAAILGGVAWIDHNGYQRAEKAAIARENAAELAAQNRQAAIQKQIADGLSQIDAANAERISQINATRSTVNTVIQKEIASSPRFTAPAEGITPAMLDALNKAREESAK